MYTYEPPCRLGNFAHKELLRLRFQDINFFCSQAPYRQTQVAVYTPPVSSDEEAAGGVQVHASPMTFFNTWQSYFTACKPPQNKRPPFSGPKRSNWFFVIESMRVSL
jgi:hypothetical protein